MSEHDHFIVCVSKSTSTEGEKKENDKTEAQDDFGKDCTTNLISDISNAFQKEIKLNRIEKSNEKHLTGIIVVPENELESDSKLKKKKKTVGIEKNFELDMAVFEMEDKIAMTDEPENEDKQEMTNEKDSLLLDSKVKSEITHPLKNSFKPLDQSVKKIVKRSSSADRIKDIERSVMPSQPIPATEVEEVVTELETIEDADIAPRHKSSVTLTRTASRVSSRVSRMSRTVQKLICCGVTMEVPSDEMLPARDGHAI